MKSQWECLLQNLGQWQGSFTRFSPQGELLEDTPTVVSLEGLNDDRTIRQTIRRFFPSQEVKEQVLEYSSLGRSTLFFDNGAFSQGSIQLAPFSEFGTELGLIDHCSKRLRLVQIFDKQGQLDKLTLIREKLVGTDDWQKGHSTTLIELLGEWQGEAVTIYPDWRSPDTYTTKLQLYLDDDGKLVQELTFGNQVISSTASINGSILLFERSSQPVQVLLLPDGASSTCPQQVRVGQPFFLEVGWLLESDRRQRLIRSYSHKGEWVSLTLVREFKVAVAN